MSNLYCSCCSIAEVEVAETYCDHCVSEIVNDLEKDYYIEWKKYDVYMLPMQVIEPSQLELKLDYSIPSYLECIQIKEESFSYGY